MIRKHDFIGVAGHPDDDECTHRADGTDATYCGQPQGQHAGVDESGAPPVPLPSRFFQYATSTDPAVIEVVEAQAARYPAFCDAALAWAQERGYDSFLLDTHFGRFAVGGLVGKPKGEGFGQWTQSKNGQSVPFRTNTVEREIMSALTVPAVEIPGLPTSLRSESNRDGTLWRMQPQPFVALGAAWVGLSHAPARSQNGPGFGPQWSECLASAYHLAKESYEHSAQRESEPAHA